MSGILKPGVKRRRSSKGITMSSILTNASSLVALQTLKSINMGLSETQNQISTGKAVSSARDNSAVWAISKVMNSDITGFQAISDSLSLGKSTVAVARQSAETVTTLLTKIKSKIVASQGANVDRAKLNTDITALKDQISSVVSAGQFNGLNLVDGSTASTKVLASLDRDSSQNVTSSSITVSAQDLSTAGYTAKAAFTGSTGVAADSKDSFGFSMDASGGTSDTGNIVVVDPTYAAGDSLTINIGDKSVSYTITAADVAATSTADVVAVQLKTAIEASGANVTVDYNQANAGKLVLTNTGTTAVSVSGQFKNAGSGGLSGLSAINVSTGSGATAALSSIETLIGKSIDAAAAFGSSQGRIEAQASFIGKLTTSLKTGMGSLVDANMEEASARLKALQVQQQLGVQSLSIANKAPQNLLSLFR